jgi:hypothetical protein
VLRGRLDLPSARTRPEAATNAARRMTSHRRKHFTIAPVSKKLATARLPNLANKSRVGSTV